MKRFLLTGTGSGCGKTTVTCAVLAALVERGQHPAACKCGPDYIDPMFHRAVFGVQTCNADGFFCDTNTLCTLLSETGKGCDVMVMEGVMGSYDGGEGSAHTLSERTGTPAVLVIDCKGMGTESIGAVLYGFLHYRTPNRIAGCIFNRLPERLAPQMQMICKALGTAYLGFLPKTDRTLPSRHLGLVTAQELPDLQAQIAVLARLAEQHLRLDALLELTDTPLPPHQPPELPCFSQHPVIAVARDKAFCFQYVEDLRLLEQLGCVLRFFSPLSDRQLPEADGLLLPGGYPELYARQLSENRQMRQTIAEKLHDGMPVIAECGGFLYLQETLSDETGTPYPMVGSLPGSGFRTERLQRFGYLTLTAQRDNILCQKGETLRAHEFHYWDSTNCGNGFTAEKKDGRTWHCIHCTERMYAGFPHLYLYAHPQAAVRFVQTCAIYGGTHGTHPEHSAIG